MTVTDSKQVTETVHAVRQSFKFVILSIVGIQVIIAITLFLVIFAFGFLATDTLIIISKGTLLTFFILLLIAADIVFVLNQLIAWKNIYYLIGPSEVVVRSGLFNRKEKSYQLNQLETVSVIQGFFGRMFDYGTLRLYSPLLDTKLNIFQIPNPHKYKELILQSTQQNAETKPQATLFPDIDGFPQ